MRREQRDVLGSVINAMIKELEMQEVRERLCKAERELAARSEERERQQRQHEEQREERRRQTELKREQRMLSALLPSPATLQPRAPRARIADVRAVVVHDVDIIPWPCLVEAAALSESDDEGEQIVMSTLRSLEGVGKENIQWVF